MSLWVVRAGRYGEREQDALDNGLVTIGWHELSDLSNVGNKSELSKIIFQNFPNIPKGRASNWTGQLWRFIREIKVGDLVALPLKSQSAIAIGEIKSEYQYWKDNENLKHVRLVNWLKTIPRSAFDQDILYSFGALQTVCQVKRHDAENRVKKLVQQDRYGDNETDSQDEPEETLDIEEIARDEIVKYVGAQGKFEGEGRLSGQGEGCYSEVIGPRPEKAF